MGAGRLYLLPAWLADDTDPAAVMPAPVLERIRRIDAFVVEDAKSARRFLAACGHPLPLREISMVELNEHTPAGRVAALLEPALAGRDLGVLSEAGASGRGRSRRAPRGRSAPPRRDGRSVRGAVLDPARADGSGLEGTALPFTVYLPAESLARRGAIAELAPLRHATARPMPSSRLPIATTRCSRT